MIDLSTTIAAKSDQLNADDLIAGPITVTVTRVTKAGDPEQPVSIYYEGDGGKPYKPGKSMRRVLVQIWGKDGDAYVGRSMTLYRDPEVTFGKLKVGGIRISHMTDIAEERLLALAVTKGAKRAYTVAPLRMQPAAPATMTIEEARAAIDAATTLDALSVAWRRKLMAPHRAALQSALDARKATLEADLDEDDEIDATDENDAHPARALADAVILRCEEAKVLGDVIMARDDFAKHRDAAPGEIVAEVDRAVDTATARLKGE